jgi:glutamate formiminotransferase / 5-formyltetrahydrofolate cyclo-ligase
LLLAVPNVSEGRDRARIERLGAAFARGASLLDTHSDPVHNRTVLTLAGERGALAEALAEGARACIEEIDMRHHDGAHPCIGVLDVCPVVWLHDADRADAHAEAIDAATRLADAGIPVFLYGDLATDPARRERAFFRAGGLARLRRRLGAGELSPDYGPAEPHLSAGATLVTARPPLAAFNVALRGIDIDQAREIAAGLRESGGGPAGVRAIAIELGDGRIQISTNIHDPVAVPLSEVLAAVRVLASPHLAEVVSAEVVGLVPEAAFDAWLEDVPLTFDCGAQTIERRVELSPRSPGAR